MTEAKAAVLRGLGEPFTIETVEWDELRADEVGVRVLACGVCHSDWHCATGDYPVEYPILTGHEGVGIVEEVGANVSRISVGDHVVLSWMPACGHCKNCVRGMGQLCERGAALLSGTRPDGTSRVRTSDGTELGQFAFLGAYSEYVVVPEDGCIVVEKDLPLAKLPLVGCRLPTGWGAVNRTAKVTAGSSALVVGLGGVGISALQGLRSAGATTIVAADVVDKAEAARTFGATHFIQVSGGDLVEKLHEIAADGVDFAFDCIGKGEVQSQTVESLRVGGTAVWVGVAPIHQKQVSLNAWELTLFQKSILGTCYGGASPFELAPVLLQMYRAGLIQVEELTTAEYALADINLAYQDMLDGKNICGVIVFDR
jgi:NDMA-dependent alcohol dehydrogenase